MKTGLKLITLAAVFSAASIQAPPAAAARNSQPIYYSCDPRELVRIAGIVVGDPDRQGGPSFSCQSTPMICELQRGVFDEQTRVSNLAKLADMVRACRAAGY